ncbi:MAG: glycosyltransferase family 61 protein [Alphaproteobacteria bacterium]|nr:glycosyltransferase family 61 protein [Alphaproteobacteria bacterium]
MTLGYGPARGLKTSARSRPCGRCNTLGLPFFSFTAQSEGVGFLRGIGPVEGSNKLEYRYIRPETFCGLVRDADVIPTEGAICTGDRRVIFQSLTAKDYEPKNTFGSYLQGERSGKAYRLQLEKFGPPVRHACIFLGGTSNFGHFVCQYLLRLALVDRIPDIADLPVAIFSGLPERYLQFLELVGLGPNRRFEVPSDQITTFESAWIFSSPVFRAADRSLNIWPEAYWWLRLKVSKLLGPATTPRLKIYLERGTAKWRRMLNEGAVKDALGKQGFHIVELSTLSAENQIRAVGNAAIIVCASGASAQITIFAPCDCVVIELMPPNFHAFFGPVATAAVLGQSFARVIGRHASPAETVSYGLQPSKGPTIIDQSDYFADLDAMNRLVALAMS